jgi:hypothetical protein
MVVASKHETTHAFKAFVDASVRSESARWSLQDGGYWTDARDLVDSGD